MEAFGRLLKESEREGALGARGSTPARKVGREWRRKGLNSLNPRPKMAGALRLRTWDTALARRWPVPHRPWFPVADAA
jgi:hypothetical protein